MMLLVLLAPDVQESRPGDHGGGWHPDLPPGPTRGGPPLNAAEPASVRSGGPDRFCIGGRARASPGMSPRRHDQIA